MNLTAETPYVGTSPASTRAESHQMKGLDARAGGADPRPTRSDLETLFRIKYGEPDATGPSPRARYRLDYFTPDDLYEATVAKLVDERTDWSDVGCGRDLFPGNRPLARLLAGRCRTLVGIDPDDTLEENPLAELYSWRLLKAVGLGYPENCLLGVYERVDDRRAAPDARQEAS